MAKPAVVAGIQTSGSGLPAPGSWGGTTNSGASPGGGPAYHLDYTNGLWIECINEGGGALGLNLHNTVNGDNYQLLSTTNLLNEPWDLGQIIYGASDGETPFPSPVTITNANAMFFRAHNAYPVINITAVLSAIEPTNGSSGQNGVFYVSDEVTATNNVTVYYSISGTATNGVDYETIGTTITIPANQFQANIQIVPIDVGIRPDQSVVLTLVQNTNYLIDPSSYNASNALYANPELYPVAYGDNEAVCPYATDYFGLAGDVFNPSGLPLSYTVVTNAAHATVSIDSSGMVTYTTSDCFEGLDSFAYTATSGGYSSAPAIVTVNVADPVSAGSAQVSTCRGAPVSVGLSGSDSCDASLSYEIISNPTYGQVTVSGSSCDYTPNTGFTGTDSFVYMVTAPCGDWATNTVTVTVGDANIYANNRNVMTDTNQLVGIALSAQNEGGTVCDTNDWRYSVTTEPTSGTLTGSGANLIYTPNPGFEGMDAFQFVVSDGQWLSTTGTVMIGVVGAPTLASECNPFGPAAALAWTEDPATEALLQNDPFDGAFFVVGRSSNPNGPFTIIATNSLSSAWAYWDGSAPLGQTNYYVVALGFTDSDSGITYQSAFSNTAQATGKNPNNLIGPTSVWYVTDWAVEAPADITTNQPVFTGRESGPFGHPMDYAAQANAAQGGAFPPLPAITTNLDWNWTNCHTMSNHMVLNLTGYTSE